MTSWKVKKNVSLFSICRVNASNQANIEMYWNYRDHHAKPLQNLTKGLSNFQGSFIDNMLYCKFSRKAIVNITIPDEVKKKNSFQIFDLNLTPFHILMATGPDNSNGTIGQHSKTSASEDPYDFRFRFLFRF